MLPQVLRAVAAKQDLLHLLDFMEGTLGWSLDDAQIIQHLCCEFRKLLFANDRQVGERERTSDNIYREWTEAAQPRFRRWKALKDFPPVYMSVWHVMIAFSVSLILLVFLP